MVANNMVKKVKYNILFWSLGLIIAIFSVYNQQYIRYDHIFIQFIITLSGILSAIFLILRKTSEGVSFCKYWLGAVDELRKVTWPTKKEIIQTTLAVIIMVSVSGLILWTVDSVLIKLVAWLLQKGGR